MIPTVHLLSVFFTIHFVEQFNSWQNVPWMRGHSHTLRWTDKETTIMRIEWLCTFSATALSINSSTVVCESGSSHRSSLVRVGSYKLFKTRCLVTLWTCFDELIQLWTIFIYKNYLNISWTDMLAYTAFVIIIYYTAFAYCNRRSRLICHT